VAYTITDGIKTELKKFAPRFVRTAKIHAHYYNAALRVTLDFTTDVVSWGSGVLTSTVEGIKWEKSNHIMRVKNHENTFNKASADSFFVTNGVAPRECVLELDFFVRTSPSVKEQFLKYVGRLKTVNVILDDTFNTAELVTVAEATHSAETFKLQKAAGGRMELPVGVFRA